MRRKTSVVLDGKTFVIPEMGMRQVDQIDDWLATLPRPPLKEADLGDMAAAVQKMVAAVGEPAILPGLPPDQQQAFSLNLRTQISATIGEKLKEMGDADWPPQMMGGGGYDIITGTPAGRLHLFRVALADAGMNSQQVDDLYAEVGMREFSEVVSAFLPTLPAEDADPNAPPADGGQNPSAGTTSTTPSPPPTAGPPPSSTT